MSTRWTAGLAGACLLIGAPAAEARTWTVRSPDRTVSAAVRASRGAVTVTARSGGRLAFRARLRAGGRVEIRRRRISQRFETPAGKRRVHLLRAAVLTLRMTRGRRVEVLAAGDGVAIRQRDVGAPRYRVPAGSRAWLQRYLSNYEGVYRATDLRDARGEYGFPGLFATPAGTWTLLTEGGFGAARLRARDGALQVARADGGMSPWRLAVIGDLGDVVGSSLPLALGRRSRIRDTSWIRPGRAAWSWWSDSASPGSLEAQRQYVDAAAARGWEYVLVDEGWDAAWMPGLVRYASDRGVRILLWTHWRDLREPASRARLLDRWAGWGVAGVKVDFLQSDRRSRIAIYDAIAGAAARRRLVVDFHGCTLPRGIQRTWPNVLTMEAVLGAEHAKGGRAIAAAHDVNLVFTRNAIGSMDYTPVLSAGGSTLGHQLALAVAFESGVQHLADRPDLYASRPAADALLRALPVAWDDTRLLGGAPDSHATLARRAGEEWWVASVHAGPATQAVVPLDFLEPGRAYRATIVDDDLGVTETTVTSTDRLTLPVAADGGLTARLRP